jgi:hypothetical protein
VYVALPVILRIKLRVHHFKSITNMCLGVNSTSVRDKKRKNDEDNLERSFSTVKSLASSANMDNYQKLKEIDCPITKVVLFTVMGTVLTKKTKVDPKASLYQSDRRKSLFSDNKEHATLEKRCSKHMKL